MPSRIIAFVGIPGAGKDTAAHYLRTTYPNICILKFAEPLQDIVALIEGNYDTESFTHRTLFHNSLWKNTPSIDMDRLRTDKVLREAVLTKIVRVICNVSPYNDRKLSSLQRTFLSADSESIDYSGEDLYQIIDSAWDNTFTETYYSPRHIQKLFGTDLARVLIHKDIWVSIMRERLADIQDNQIVLITDLRFPNEYTLVVELAGKLVYIDNPDALQIAVEAGLLNHVSEQVQDFLKQKAWYRLVNRLDSEYFQQVNTMYQTFLWEFVSQR